MIFSISFVKKTAPYELCEQVVKEVAEKRKPNTYSCIRRKVCKKCGKTFFYWEELHYPDFAVLQVHNEKMVCDKCGRKLKNKPIRTKSVEEM